MGNPLTLDDFSLNVASTDSQASPLSEDARLAAFEEGYKAGWDDVLAAQAKDSDRIGEELARNIADLSFTYHEVRTNMLNALRPLLTEIMSKVLPVAATGSLPELITENVSRISETSTELPIAIVVHPSVIDAVDAILPSSSSIAVSTTADPTLTEGQALIRFQENEKEINLDGAIQGMNDALKDFFDAEFEHKERANGTK